MSIAISNNLQTQYYSPTVKKEKAEAGNFTIPETNEPEPEPFDVSDAHSKGIISDDEFRIFQNDLLSRARVLQGIGMNDEQLLAWHEARTAKIVFEFGDDASIRIKPGLTKAEYDLALETLKEIEYRRRGGLLPR
jgi:hypothetical protein